MKKNARKTLKYRFRMWIYRLTKEDIYNFINEIIDNTGIILGFILIFLLAFIPALLR